MDSGSGDEHHILSRVNPGRLPNGERWIYSKDAVALLGIVLALADVRVWPAQSCLWSLINSHRGYGGPERTDRGKHTDEGSAF